VSKHTCVIISMYCIQTTGSIVVEAYFIQYYIALQMLLIHAWTSFVNNSYTS